MVNEIISWATKKNESLFILKVDFEKAFDSVYWKFLDHIMEQIGFSVKWRKWIHGCLDSAYTSVLINGSPTKEFKINKGLRQGDPLSPYLFILAAEALHVSLQEAKMKNVFQVLRYDGDECDKGRIPTKIELTLEQSQQGVSNDVLRNLDVTSFEEVILNQTRWHGYHGKRFHTESHSLWHQIITSIHDPSGSFGSTVRQPVSPWWTISNLNNSLSSIVASMQREIENHVLCDQLDITRWNKSLPIKINVHTWRLYLDRLPARCNLDSRGGTEEEAIELLLARQKDDPKRYNDETIRGLLLGLLSAGTTTSASILEWAFLLLLNHPEVHHKAQRDTAIIPNCSLLVPQESSKDCKVGGAYTQFADEDDTREEVFSGDIPEVLEAGKRFRKILDDSFLLAGSSNLGDYLSFLSWLGVNGFEKKLLALREKREVFFQELIEQVRKLVKADQVQHEKKTMIDVLFSLQKLNPDYYTDEMIRDFVLVLLSAGSETSSGTMEWALSLMLNNPQILEKAHNEIDIRMGKDHLIKESNILDLPYLRSIINETLRLYPSAPLLVPHESSEDYVVGGYHIPCRTILLINQWAIHHDPKLWNNPESFNPERFESLQGTRDGFKLMPFGLGRKSCPGEVGWSGALVRQGSICNRDLQTWACLADFRCLVKVSIGSLLSVLLPPDHIDLFDFIHASDPTKVRVVKREREDDEPWLLETTVGRTVPLLPVATDRAESELEASVDRLFDKGGSGHQTEQEDSAEGWQDANFQPVVEAADTSFEDAAPLQSRCQRKRKFVVVDAGGDSHPLKKLREDYGNPSGASIGASVSTTPECEDEDHTDSVAEPNLHTIGAPSSTPIMTTATTVTSTVESTLVAKEKPVKPSLFATDSSSAGGADPNTGVFSDLTGSDFLVCGIRTVIDPDIDLLKHDQLFIEFNVGAARQMSLSVEVRMRVEYNAKERRRLKSVVEKQDELLKARDGEIENLKAQLLLKEAEAAEAIRLRAQTSNLEAVEKSPRDEVNALKWRNIILKKEQDALDVKVIDLEALVVGKERGLTDLNAQLTSVKSQNDSLADQVHVLEVSSAKLQEKITVYDRYLAEMACHLEEKFYPYLLNTISGWRWLLTHGLNLFLVKCLNSSEYLMDLGAAISHAIEKGMQSGLAAGIDHGREGMSLADVAAYNPNAEANFNTALQELREVDFPLLAKLKSYKDASMEDIMNVLRLEGALAEAPGMNYLQLDVEELNVPIHRSEDQIKENIAPQRSALVGVWTPLSDPLSVTSLMGKASTFGVVPTASMNYEIVGVDGQEGAGTDGRAIVDGNVSLFPNVDDVDLHIP
nr:cytochrome P450 81E8-like [Tanacetum cinerariifolium]